MKRFIKIIGLCIGSVLLVGCSTSQNGQAENESVQEIKIPTYATIPEATQITVDGQPVTIESKRAYVGDELADVQLALPAGKFNETTFTKLSESKKVKVIYTAPSIDTPVCSLQTKQLETYAKKKTEVDFYIVSADLPFAQSRFCTANKIDNLKTLSDFKNLEWGRANGFAMKEYGLLVRSIMVVDQNDVIQYIEYTNEVTGETNLGNALAYLEQVLHV